MGIEMFLRQLDDGPVADPGMQSPGSFSVSTQLMQDAVPADGVSVGSGTYNQEALFANPFKDGREELMVINERNELTYLERTDASDTGWIQETVPGLPALAEVVVAVHPSGDVWAICSPQADDARVFGLVLALGEREPDGTARCVWTGKTDFGHRAGYARSLCVTYSPGSGPLVLGTSLDVAGGSVIFVLTPQLPSAGGGPAWVEMLSDLLGTGFPVVGGGFLPCSPATGKKNVFVYYFLKAKELIRWEESADGLSGPLSISKTVDQFCGSYYVPNLNRDNPQGDVGFAYIDGTNLVTGSYSAPGHRLMTDSVVGGFDPQAEARVWQDADGRLHVFGTDQHGALQVLHQTTWKTVPQGTGSDNAQVVQPAWTTARVAAAPKGIGGYDLARPNDRVVAFDYAGSGKSDHLLAYRPGPIHYYNDQSVFVVKRTNTPGGFDTAFSSTSGLPGYDFSSYADQVVAYDYRASGSADHLLVYRPGAGKFSILKKQDTTNGFVSVVSADSGGIGKPGLTYDLAAKADRLEPFDYTGSGKNDHLLAYRPGTGTAWVLAPQEDGTFDAVVRSPTGLGGFTLNNGVDIVVGFDYNGSGSNTHLLAYRPGRSMVYILAPDGKGGFTTVVSSDTNGIGGYDLKSTLDRLVPFDYTGLGKNDHLLAYRPGSAIAWILERKENTNTYTAVPSFSGLGGYDFANPADTVTAYDYNSTGGLAYLVAYRPGAGKVSVMGQRGGEVTPVYQAPPGPASIVTVGVHAKVTKFRLDPYPDYKPSELIKMSGMTNAEAYCICTQDVTTSHWQTDKVRIPPAKVAQPPFVVSHYVADATLLSKQRMALAGHNVSISADSLVEVQIGAVSYQVGPGRAISVTTNAMGKLVLAIAARGLNPPVVHLNADGLQTGTAVDFAAQANDFLAGKGTLPSQTGRLTPDLLEHAQVTPNMAGLSAANLADWPALKERGLTPQAVVDHCTNMYSQAAGGNGRLQLTFDGFDEPQPVVGYVIQLWDPDRPAFQAFRTQDELDAYKAYRDAHPSYGGWWDDFTNWASDVWEGIKTGAQRIAEVIVSTVVEIAVWIGNAVVSLGEMIIDAIEQAIQAVEAVFQMIADAIMRVIDWLKSLFSFADIWDTKTALQGATTQLLEIGADAVTKAGQLSHTWFEEQRANVIAYFAEVKQQFATTSAGDFENVTPLPATSAGSKPTTSDLQQNPQASWMFNRLGANSASGLLDAAVLKSPADSPLADAFTEFVGILSSASLVNDVVDALGEVATAVGKLIDPANPRAAATAGVLALLSAVENLALAALKGLDEVANQILDLVSRTLPHLNDLFNWAPDLGPINALYEWLQPTVDGKPSEQLTFGGLLHLINAFFVTVVYKLFNGVTNPPFPGGTFPPILRPGAGDDLGGAASAIHFWQTMAGLCGILNVVCSAIGDALVLWAVGPENDLYSWVAGGNIVTQMFSSLLLSLLAIGARPDVVDPGTIIVAVSQMFLLFLRCATLWRKLHAGGETAWPEYILGGVGGPIVITLTGLLRLAGMITYNLQHKSLTWFWIRDMASCVSTVDAFARVKVSEKDPTFKWRIGGTAVINAVASAGNFVMTMVSGAGQPPSWNLPAQLTGNVGQPLNLDMKLHVSGGNEPYNQGLQLFTMAGADPKLRIDPNTGVITGTPDTATTYNVTFTVSDHNAPPLTASASTELVISP